METILVTHPLFVVLMQTVKYLDDDGTDCIHCGFQMISHLFAFISFFVNVPSLSLCLSVLADCPPVP